MHGMPPAEHLDTQCSACDAADVALPAGKIYVFDTGSEPSLEGTLAGSIARGHVEYIPWHSDFGTRDNSTSRQPPTASIAALCN